MQVMVRLVKIAAWARLREWGGGDFRWRCLRGFGSFRSPGRAYFGVEMLEKSVFFVSLKYGMNALSS